MSRLTACGIERASDKRLLLAALGVALLVRVAAIGALRPWERPQAWENGAIARSIAAGRGFAFDYSEGEIANYHTLPEPVPTSFQAPFYPYLLAGFYVLGRQLGSPLSLVALLVLQAAVGAVLVIPVFHLGYRFFDKQTGLLAAAIVAVYPSFLYTAAIFHQGVWAITGFALGFLALLNLGERPGRCSALVFGGILGALLFIEPVFFGFMVAGFAGLLIVQRERRRLVAWGALAFVLSLIVVSPWLVRCYLVHHRFVFVKSSSGFNLWQGNNPACNGTPHSEWRHVPYPAPPALLARLRRTDDELERDAIWRDAAVSALRADPMRGLTLFAKKALFFWTLTPYHRLTRSTSYWLPYAIMLPAAIMAMIRRRKRLVQYMPLLLVFAAGTLVYSVTFPGPRYRMPLEPLLFLFSAASLAAAIRLAAGRFAVKVAALRESSG